METHHKQVARPVICCRIGDVMAHIHRYSLDGNARLSRATNTSESTISRLLKGQLQNPSFRLIARITEALEKELGYRIDPRELVSECGAFLTRYVCDLLNCRGCMPIAAHSEQGDLKPRFADVMPGRWVSSEYPHGYQRKEANNA